MQHHASGASKKWLVSPFIPGSAAKREKYEIRAVDKKYKRIETKQRQYTGQSTQRSNSLFLKINCIATARPYQIACAAQFSKLSSLAAAASLLRMASVARVNRRLRRYYLIVRLLPNVFALAYRSLGSIYYDTGSPHDGKTPFGWLHPCRLVTDSRRYLIVGASAAMPLYSSFIFSLNNRACQQLAKLLLLSGGREVIE